MKLISLLIVLAAGLAIPFAETASAQSDVSPAAAPAPSPMGGLPEGFVMTNGRVYVVSRGQAVPLLGEMTLRVGPGGIIGFDQVPRQLREDSMLTMDGRVIAAPPGIVFAAPARPAMSPEEARVAAQRMVTGENTSGLAPPGTGRPPVQPSVPPMTVGPVGVAILPPRNGRPAPVPSTTTTTTPANTPVTVVTPVPAQVQITTTPLPPLPATQFDPNQVNDGSIEAAGTGTRRPSR